MQNNKTKINKQNKNNKNTLEQIQVSIIRLSEQMGFKVGLKYRDRVHVSNVRGEGVPEVGGRATESSEPHGGQIEWEDLQFYGGARPEGPGGNVNMNEVRQIWRGEVVYGLECVEEDLVINAVFYREPVELV